MTRTNTQTVSIAVPPAQVFEFLADPETLPLWAVGFCRGIRKDRDGWVAATGHGDVAIRYDADRGRGTIDFHFSPAPGVEITAFSRVLPHEAGAEYVFTQFQPPGMPDDVFDGQVDALGEELRVLSSVLRARSSCAT